MEHVPGWSSDHTSAHEHRSAPCRSLVPPWGSRTAPRWQWQVPGPHCLVSLHADCRYTCHQECLSLIQLDCRRPSQCQSQLSPESTLLPPCSQVRGEGAPRGQQPHGDPWQLLSERAPCSRRVLQEGFLLREVLQPRAALSDQLPVSLYILSLCPTWILQGA